MTSLLFDKHPDLVVRQVNPFNAGPPPKLLNRSYITPMDLFFVRNHGQVPEVDVDSYRLEINGRVSRPLSLSLGEIQNNFERVNVSATLQCAGNRREELMALKSIPNELGWGVDAISHAVWAGVRLRDVLSAAGVESEASLHLHVEFGGLDEIERLNKCFRYGGSIPLAKGLSPEVILAYEMNGEPLTPCMDFRCGRSCQVISARAVLSGWTVLPCRTSHHKIIFKAMPIGCLLRTSALRLWNGSRV